MSSMETLTRFFMKGGKLTILRMVRRLSGQKGGMLQLRVTQCLDQLKLFSSRNKLIMFRDYYRSIDTEYRDSLLKSKKGRKLSYLSYPFLKTLLPYFFENPIIVGIHPTEYLIAQNWLAQLRCYIRACTQQRVTILDERRRNKMINVQ